ncbi:D-3-phosphoglycerate dehydrogenase [hydrothermal vent metagenome]|uniref:D-3-phosphoglycerate dehydrogenase n=1 Tax=hydrothermal vent metagenome TaxID=652676 RepID=A0A3B1DCQ4_9ZZZZ
MTTPLVIQTEELDAEPAAWLAERCELVACRYDDPGFGAVLARADGLVVRTYTVVDTALLAAAPRLRVVARAGVGVDNIDLEACWGRGVVVVNTPGANTRAVVEFVVASVLDAIRPRLFLHEALDREAWGTVRKDLEAPRQLADCTVGVLGFGRIGSQVARAFGAMDAKVIYHDLREIEPGVRFGAEPVGREELFAQADIVTVHVDGRRSNYHIVDAAACAHMREDVVFLNTSRGFVVDPVACAEFFVDHPGAMAILDVHDPEPIVETSPLLEIANVHLSPHIAGATRAAKREMSWVVRDVWRVLSGEEPGWPVLPVE